MRLFIAINIPAPIRDAIYGDSARLRAAADAVRWVSAPSLHMTVKFIGEWPESAVDDVRAAVEHVAARHSPFEVETTSVGAFPNFRRPRVVWLGVTGEARLRALAGDVDRMCASLGIAAETRPFQPHLTLGRVKRELRPAEATALAAAAGEKRPRRAFPVRTVDLMSSELGPGGSKYSVVAAVPLHP